MIRYSNYKDSDVDWIGKIPEHWSLKKTKYIRSKDKYSLVDGPFGSNLKSEHYVENGDVYIIESGFITSGKFKMVREFKTITREHFDTIKRSECFRDCIIIAKIGEYYGMSGILPTLDKPSVVSGNSVSLKIDEKHDTKFIHLVLVQHWFNGTFKKEVQQTGQPFISLGVVDNISFPIPPLPEQQAIVTYLDEKTTLIDDLIKKKQEKIQLLKENRTALINHVVTKGLDPEVEMKDSGVEWIGEVPKEWRVVPLKYVTLKKNGIKTGPFGTQLNTKDYVPTGVKVLNQKTLINEDYSEGDEFISNDKYNDLKEFQVVPKDIILGTRGSFGKQNRTTFGKCSIVPDSIGNCVLHPCLIRIRLSPTDVLNNYLYYYINDSTLFLEHIIQSSNSTTIEVIYGITLRDIKFVIPPITEQQQIVTYLDEQTQLIDQTIQQEEQKIDLLKEYRQSLISEVVTGKICVV